MSIGEAFDAHEKLYSNAIQQETWGHLAPKKDQEYQGFIIYSLGCYGDHCVIQVKFKDLPDSPWFYEHLNEFVSNMLGKKRVKHGTVFKFTGTYKVGKRGSYSFRGVAVPLKLE
jgi:hypothetical protein